MCNLLHLLQKDKVKVRAQSSDSRRVDNSEFKSNHSLLTLVKVHQDHAEERSKRARTPDSSRRRLSLEKLTDFQIRKGLLLFGNVCRTVVLT